MGENLLEEIYKIENKFFSQNHAALGINVEDLDSPNFNVDKFIVLNFSLRDKDKYDRALDVPKVQKSIEYFHQIQKQTCEEIVDSIDKNLEKYIDISSQFEKMKEKLQKTSQKFDVFNNTILQYTEKTKSNKEKIENTLSSYRNLQNMESIHSSFKYFLSILKDCHETIVSLEGASKQGNVEKQLDELVFVSFKYAKGEELFQQVIKKNAQFNALENKFSISAQINKLKLRILDKLTQNFSKYIEKYFSGQEKQPIADKKTVRRVLQSYVNLSCQSQAQLILKDSFVAKLVAQIAAKAKEAKANTAVATRQELIEKDLPVQKLPLGLFFEGVLGLITTGKIKDLLEITEFEERATAEYSNQQVGGYNLLANVIWATAFEVLLQKDFNTVFSVGIPDLFNLNYKISLKFINQMKEQFKNKKNLKEFLKADTTKKFFGKWGTSTYYQLRLTEAAKDLDKALVYSPEQTNTAQYSEIVWSRIVKIFHPNIFNLTLTPKFLRLAFLLVGAYCNFIKQIIPVEFKKENADQNALIKIVTDLNALGGKLKAEFPNIVIEALKREEEAIELRSGKEGKWEGLHQRVPGLLEEFFSMIKQAIKFALQPVIEKFYDQCQKNLEPFIGVPTKYRMTNKEMPSAPSSFMGNIFYPLNQFIQNNQLQGLVKSSLEQEVLNRIYEKFLQIAKEILSTVEKAENVLSKYKQDSTSKKAEDQSDYIKIKKQFHLDNLEFLKIANQYTDVSLANFNPACFQ